MATCRNHACLQRRHIVFQVLKEIGTRLSASCTVPAAGQRTFHSRAVSPSNAVPERLTKITNIAAFKKDYALFKTLSKQSVAYITFVFVTERISGYVTVILLKSSEYIVL